MFKSVSTQIKLLTLKISFARINSLSKSVVTKHTSILKEEWAGIKKFSFSKPTMTNLFCGLMIL